MVSGGRANFSLISLKNSTNCLHENANSSRGEGGGGGWLKLFPEPNILSNM